MRRVSRGSLEARTLLEAWTGRTIATFTGAPNRVLAVSGDAAMIGTDRSPQGQPVRFSLVQAALDRMAQDGRVSIDVETLGHRSAFCGAVLLTLPGVVRIAPQEVAMRRSRQQAVIRAEDRGAISPWWERDARERFWMEITDRTDIGVDLHCPQRDAAGRANPGYSTILFARQDDVVFHYDRRQRAVVSWSRVAGTIDVAPIEWTSHRAATRRRLGATPKRQPGWAVDLEGPFLLERPISLDALRRRGRQPLAVLDRLGREHGSIYAPFYRHGSTLRPTQYYLTKLPAEIVASFEEMRSVAPRRRSVPPVGTVWRGRSAASPPARRRLLEIDFEAIERGTRGHERTEALLAAVLRTNGVEPLQPTAGDPNFDLAWRLGDEFYVAEVKSTTRRNIERQLRLGFGQVLRYRHLIAERTGTAVHAILVPEREPDDPTWVAACLSAGVSLIPAPRIEQEIASLLERRATASGRMPE